MPHILYKTFIVFVLLFIFFVAFGGVSHNARWRITHIDVRGTQAVDREAVQSSVETMLSGNYYFVYARNNSYLFPAREVEMKLKETFIRLATVTVEKVDEHTIAVVVTERKPYALWCGDDFSRETYELAECSFIDETGFIFDHAPVFSEGVYMEFYGRLDEVRDGSVLGAQLPRARFVFAHVFEKAMRENIGNVLRIVMKDEGEYRAIAGKSTAYSELIGVELRLVSTTPPAEIVQKLSKALATQFPDGAPPKKKLNYIDLRFGNKIPFGFEN